MDVMLKHLQSRAPFRMLILLVVTALVYWPGLGGGFIFDDRPNISANIALQVTTLRWDDWIAAIFSSPAALLPRPLAMFTFAINHYFTGLDPAPMKLTNVAIHLVNVVLVFLLSRQLLRLKAAGSPAAHVERIAYLVAALWALHPINLMAVLYVVQRMESLCHVFVFSGLLLYVRGRVRQLEGDGGWGLVLLGLLGCSLAGALSKESALLLPLYGLCLETCIFRFKGHASRTSTQLKAMYALLLFVPALAALAWLLPPALHGDGFDGRNFTLVERLLTEARVLVDYVRWILFPSLQQMSIYHDDYAISRSILNPPATLLALLSLVALATIALRVRVARPLAALGILFFLSGHAMTATIIPLELVFEHRNYFASFGIFLTLADLLLLTPVSETGRKAGTALVLLLLAVAPLQTALRAWEWRNPLSFAISEAGKHPDSPRAVYALGVALSNVSGLRADSPLTLAAFSQFDRARRLRRTNILPDQAALMLASRVGVPYQQAWWTHMQQTLQSQPIGAQELGALSGLSNCAVERRCDFPEEEMLATFKAAFSRGPNPELQNIFGGYALNVLSQPDMALYQWQKASEQNPAEPQYRISQIKLLILMRQFAEAQHEIDQLRALGRLGQYNKVADELQARRVGAEGAVR